MKRFLSILAVALAALTLLVSCDKEKGGEERSDIVGTWTMHQESTHYFQVSFDAKGNFDWQVLGVSELRETGSYTMVDGIITLNTEKYYDRWDDSSGTEYKDRWIEKKGKPVAGYPDDFNGKRTIKVVKLMDGLMLCKISNDPMFGDFLSGAYLFLDGYDQSLASSDLDGTWIYKNAAGQVVSKYDFKGKNYSRKVYIEYRGSVNPMPECEDSGTWTYNKGIITLEGSESLAFATARIFLSGSTLYVSNPLDWGFDVNGYTYTKQ